MRLTHLRPLAGIALALGLSLPVLALTPAEFIEGAREADADISIDRETDIIKVGPVHLIFADRNEKILPSTDSQHQIEGVVAFFIIDVEMPDDEVIESISSELQEKYGVILTKVGGNLAVATCERGLEELPEVDVLGKINHCFEQLNKALSMSDDE